MSKRTMLGDLLVLHQLISRDQLEASLAEQKESGLRLGELLVSQGLVTEEDLLQVRAQQAGESCWHLQHQPPSKEALERLPATVCIKHRILPVKVTGRRLTVAMQDPSDLDLIELAQTISGNLILPVMADAARLSKAIAEHYGDGDVSAVGLDQLVTDALDEIVSESADAECDEAPVSEDEMRPVISIVDQFIGRAIRMGASDIHIEPRRETTEVRFRVDGVLQRTGKFPAALHRAVVARIKVMSLLDLIEYRIPQDGRLSVRADGRRVDVRVSVLPTIHGQRVVMRLLDKDSSLLSLDNLGFTKENLCMIRQMIERPHGMVLVTGPTGSGKTTTLYAALNELRSESNNIMTCEDPIEYDLDGINQSQVNEKVGLTFATQLRSILRQDPDIILVGEIRDAETAETAFRAALTGHLVLATLHANDAPSAIARLSDIGVEPFLISTALIGVVAQRLARKLCSCKEAYDPDSADAALVRECSGPSTPRLFRPGSCPTCFGTGYRGRIGIHEVLPVTGPVATCIKSLESSRQIAAAAEPYGYRPMRMDAMDRVVRGDTTIEELLRVVVRKGYRIEERQDLPMPLAA